MFDKEFNRPDEMSVPEELHVPREFHEPPEPFAVGPFSTPLPEEFVSDEREPESVPEPLEGAEGVARRKNNLMQMMYLAALLTSMAASASIYSGQQKRFDINSFVRTHHDWVDETGEEYLYFGDDGWGFTCRIGEDGKPYGQNDFTRFKMNTFQIDEYSCMNYAVEWDWGTVSARRSDAVTKFVQKDDGYVLEVYAPDSPLMIKQFTYVESDKAVYEYKDDMQQILGLSLKEILERYNTYKLYEDAPVYDDFSRIVFNNDGTGIVYTGRKEHPFTYKLSEDTADNSIHMYIDGEYTYAMLFFDSGLVGLRLFDREDHNRFGYFVPVQNKSREQVGQSGNAPGGKGQETGGEDDRHDDRNVRPEFNIADHISTHRDWKSNGGSKYIYFGENGWGYFATPGAGNAGHTRFIRFKMAIAGGGKPVIDCHSYEWDGNSASMSSRDFKLEFVKDGDDYHLEMKSPGGNNVTVFRSVSAKEADYEGLGDMRAILDMDMRRILSRYNSFHVEDADTVTDNFNKMFFFSDGTGFMYMNGKEHPFTYSFNKDSADQSINMYVDGVYTYAFLSFDGGLVSVRFFGHIEQPGNFGYFITN